MIFSRGFASGFVVSVGRPSMVVPLCRGAVHRLDRVKGGPWPGRICAVPLDTTEPVGMMGVWGRCIPLPLPPRRGVGATADGVVVPY